MGCRSCLCMCAPRSPCFSLSQEPLLARLSRLIYGPAEWACHDFLKLKSPRPPPSHITPPHPTLSISPLSCSTVAAHLYSHVKTCTSPPSSQRLLQVYTLRASNVCHVCTSQPSHAPCLKSCEPERGCFFFCPPLIVS